MNINAGLNLSSNLQAGLAFNNNFPGEYCPASEFNFSGTLFMPDVDTKITNTVVGTYKADSDEKIYAIPAIGFSVPFSKDFC